MITNILLLMFTHWVADFVLQTQEMAVNKSKSGAYLMLHTTVYSLFFFCILALCNLYAIIDVLLFSLFTWLFHTITDYLTSKWTSYLYSKEKYYGLNGFFTVIGLDQFLHTVQLLLCYEYILKP